jgi:hypothetical protein
MNGSSSVQVVDTIAKIATMDRQLREIKGMVDRSFDTAKRFWPVVAVLAAGWSYMVSDEERYAMLTGIADEVAKMLPLAEVGRIFES